MEIDLSSLNLFSDNLLDLDKKVNFIFGNNGTGKSTLTSFISKEYVEDYDVRVYQGFKSVLNDNKGLNAVVLGKENVDIDNQIHEIEEIISEINKEISGLKSELIEPQDGTENLKTIFNKSVKDYKNLYNNIDKFCTEKASKIKLYQPQIFFERKMYDKNSFKADIEHANYLSDNDYNNYKKLLFSPEKTAKYINFPSYNYKKRLDQANELLNKRVEEKVDIPRLDNNLKINFAKEGLKIHEKGDVCSFCGNSVSEDTLNQLNKFFKNENIIKFEKDIDVLIKDLESELQNIKSVSLQENDFYEIYHSELIEIKNEYSNFKEEATAFYNTIIESLNHKKENLFNKSEKLNIQLPVDLINIQKKYDNLLDKNNTSELEDQKTEAKNKIRYHEVKKYLDEYNYYEKKEELLSKEYEKNKYQEEIDIVKEEIKNKEEIIKGHRFKITELLQMSSNEEILANEVSDLLDAYVNFRLIHINNDNKGYYSIKNKESDEIRNVTDLSNGEMNIIGFLYFIKKINEVDSNKVRDKILIFDDPMSSNDSNMQYIIIEELINLILNSEDDNNIKTIIILTHNHHFYLNLTSHLKNRYNKYNFFKLQSNGKNSEIFRIDDHKKDFKSNYDSLWQDLVFAIKNDDASANLLCNTSRRIIDTYINFNSIKKQDFYKDTRGAKKMFDVNSHDIEDFEADLTGLTKEKIIDVLKDCFKKNNGLNHFEDHYNKWSDYY